MLAAWYPRGISTAEKRLRYYAERFDVVLMDMHMPELDGLSATRALREREQQTGAPRMPVIAMTANAESDDGAA